MSGGSLVVLDSAGHDRKQFPLPSGVATIGSDRACDICILLPSVEPHHASVIVYAAQTVVQSVEAGRTQVNGRAVSTAPLRHRDEISVAGHRLRWEYTRPPKRYPPSPAAALAVRGGGRAGRARRGSTPGARSAVVLAARHRASMPPGCPRQVAVVQPQRRDRPDGRASVGTPPRTPATTRRAAEPSAQLEGSAAPGAESGRRRAARAPQWLAARGGSPAPRVRASLPPARHTPLRLTVLKKAQSARKPKLVKIEAPLKIDPTKQVAIMLMTGHGLKSKLSSPDEPKKSKSPTYVVKKQSPVRKTPRSGGKRGGRGTMGTTPSRGTSFVQGSTTRSDNKNHKSTTILEISDSTRNSTIRDGDVSVKSRKSAQKSPALPSPKKSAMKDLSRKSVRKTESIKFDLSNLESGAASSLAGSALPASDDDLDFTLRYSESRSPSPRRPIHSRSRRMLDKIGASLASVAAQDAAAPDAPRARTSLRGALMIKRALNSANSTGRTSTDASNGVPTDDTVASAFRLSTLSPRPEQNLECYSVVDLVSLESGDASLRSSGATQFGSPGAARRTRSTFEPVLVSSTPYATARSSRSSSHDHLNRAGATGTHSTRRSKSLTTPENTYITVESTRVSRASRSRSRINDSDLRLLDDTEMEDSSPKTSRRSRGNRAESGAGDAAAAAPTPGTSTPENTRGPEEATTPVLSIQTLLDSSRGSVASRASAGKAARATDRTNNMTVQVTSSGRAQRSRGFRSAGSAKRGRQSVTPRSTVKLSPEAVKNKHSTAKKPQSKRSMIDDLDRSDLVKQLFNSPVKRKLSQSMTEFSKKRLFEDDDDDDVPLRPTSNTIAGADLDNTGAITPERFVSPIGTPVGSPDLSGVKRLFKNNNPENDLRDVRGVRNLLRTPRARASIRNDLTDVAGVKSTFARSPNEGLRRVSGVKALFQNKSPNNDLRDVRGVNRLFKTKSPKNDLRNVSGVGRTLRTRTPRNDLSDVGGLKRLFGRENDAGYHDVSGVGRLFDDANKFASRSELLFDEMTARPAAKAVYSKTFFTSSHTQTTKTRKVKSLNGSIEIITNKVEEWLERELQKRFHRDDETEIKNDSTKRELENLATDTSEGVEPIRGSRTRNSSVRGRKTAADSYSSHTLPIKKRSLVDASLERSRAQLPIKKRLVLHSTPVKGGGDMSSSQLARVSPIAAPARARPAHYAAHRSTLAVTVQNESVVPAKARTPRKQETPKKIDVSKPFSDTSDKRTPPKRSMRSRKKLDNLESNVKRRRNSVVITKKQPTMSPKAVSGKTHDTKELSSNASPKPRRATRAKPTDKHSTSKRTKARATKATVVVTKAHPTPKPDRKQSQKKSQTQDTKSARTRAGGNVAESKSESPMPSPKNNKGRSATVVSEPKIRGKRTKIVDPEIVTESESKTRSRTKTDKSIANDVKTGNKKAAKPAPASKKKEAKPRGNKAATEKPALALKDEPKTLGKKNSTESAPAKRGKAVEHSPVPAKRGRKAAAEDTVPPIIKTRGKAAEATVEGKSKGRGKKVSFIEPEPTTQPRGRGKQAQAAEDPPTRSTRGKKIPAAQLAVSPAGRSKKGQSQSRDRSVSAPRNKSAASKATPDKLAPSPPEGRKRRAPVSEEIPAKIAKTAPKRGKKVEVIEAAAPKRATKSKTQEQKPARGAPARGAKKAEPVLLSPVPDKRTRGRQVAEPKEKVVENPKSKGKTKARGNISPAKAPPKTGRTRRR